MLNTFKAPGKNTSSMISDGRLGLPPRSKTSNFKPVAKNSLGLKVSYSENQIKGVHDLKANSNREIVN